MPIASLHALPAGFWMGVSRLGEMQLLLPTGIALAAWLVAIGQRRSAALWLALLAIAVGLTTASKVAFIGWGVGLASLNFTGVSGHAMVAAAVLPLLLHCLTAAQPLPLRHAALALGYALALAVAISRVAVGAHSPSEASAGFVLGCTASALALAWGQVPEARLPRWLLALLVAAQLINPTATETLPTHDMVTRLALHLSGRERPYTRAMMLREERERAERAYNASAVVFFTSSITA